MLVRINFSCEWRKAPNTSALKFICASNKHRQFRAGMMASWDHQEPSSLNFASSPASICSFYTMTQADLSIPNYQSPSPSAERRKWKEVAGYLFLRMLPGIFSHYIYAYTISQNSGTRSHLIVREAGKCSLFSRWQHTWLKIRGFTTVE